MEAISPPQTPNAQSGISSTKDTLAVPLFIESMTGVTAVVDVDLSGSYSQLKILVGRQMQVAPDNFVLVFKESELVSGKSLAEQGLVENCHVKLLPNLKSGRTVSRSVALPSMSDVQLTPEMLRQVKDMMAEGKTGILSFTVDGKVVNVKLVPADDVQQANENEEHTLNAVKQLNLREESSYSLLSEEQKLMKKFCDFVEKKKAEEKAERLRQMENRKVESKFDQLRARMKKRRQGKRSPTLKTDSAPSLKENSTTNCGFAGLRRGFLL